VYRLFSCLPPVTSESCSPCTRDYILALPGYFQLHRIAALLYAQESTSGRELAARYPAARRRRMSGDPLDSRAETVEVVHELSVRSSKKPSSLLPVQSHLQ
jgi:hypothetical protein